MRALFIGGTGNISTSVSLECLTAGIDLHLLTRGQRSAQLPGATFLHGDVHRRGDAERILRDERWDVVVDWVAFTPEEIERDLGLFRGRTRQFIFISSASAYQKPPLTPVITESTPLSNPFWEYSRNKIACEDRLNRAYREEGFPVTIVRPSHTYATIFPLAMGGSAGYTVIDRMQRGLPMIVHGDGTSLWTLTHSEDFAKAFVGLMGNPQAVGEAFHITSDFSLSWNQIYSEVARAAGCEPTIVHIASDFISEREPSMRGTLLGDKAHSVVFDNSKIKRFVPGFTATIPLHVGIRKTLAWFEEDPSRKVVDQEVTAKMDRILKSYQHAAGMTSR